MEEVLHTKNEKNNERQSMLHANNNNYHRLPQYTAALTATLAAMSVGICLGWTSPILDDFKSGTFHNITANPTEMGWIGSLLTIGAITTSLPAGFLCDHFGRKRLLIHQVIPFFIGWMCIINATNVTALYFGRFLLGVATGFCCVVAPLYITEIAHKDIRGVFGNLFQLLLSLGILYANVVGYLCRGNVLSYCVFCCVVPLLFGVGFVFQPESPVYYVKRGRIEAARKVLQKLRGDKYCVDSEIELIEMSTKEQTAGIKKKAVIKAFVISLSLMFFQQFSGVNTLVFYSSKIFSASNLDAKLSSILIGLGITLGTFASIFVTEKLGRKFLLISSSLLSALLLFNLGLFFTLKDRVHSTIVTNIKFVPAAASFLFIFTFGFGLGPVPWMISSEIFGPKVKGVGSAVASAFNWTMAFLITTFFLNVGDKVGMDYVYYGFGIILVGCVAFVAFLVPETKGKTILEVEDALEK